MKFLSAFKTQYEMTQEPIELNQLISEELDIPFIETFSETEICLRRIENILLAISNCLSDMQKEKLAKEFGYVKNE